MQLKSATFFDEINDYALVILLLMTITEDGFGLFLFFNTSPLSNGFHIRKETRQRKLMKRLNDSPWKPAILSTSPCS